MSPQSSRRAVLRTVSVATVAGLAGCSGGDGPTATSTADGTPYSFEVVNGLTASDFDLTDRISGTEPAVVKLRVGNMSPDDDTRYFEQTVELSPDTSETISNAFHAEEGGPTYAINAELEPFVEGGIARDRHYVAGHTFAEGSFGTPSDGTLTVRVASLESDAFFPHVTVAP